MLKPLKKFLHRNNNPHSTRQQHQDTNNHHNKQQPQNDLTTSSTYTSVSPRLEVCTDVQDMYYHNNYNTTTTDVSSADCYSEGAGLSNNNNNASNNNNQYVSLFAENHQQSQSHFSLTNLIQQSGNSNNMSGSRKSLGTGESERSHHGGSSKNLKSNMESAAEQQQQPSNASRRRSHYFSSLVAKKRKSAPVVSDLQLQQELLAVGLGDDYNSSSSNNKQAPRSPVVRQSSTSSIASTTATPTSPLSFLFSPPSSTYNINNSNRSSSGGGNNINNNSNSNSNSNQNIVNENNGNSGHNNNNNGSAKNLFGGILSRPLAKSSSHGSANVMSGNSGRNSHNNNTSNKKSTSGSAGSSSSSSSGGQTESKQQQQQQQQHYSTTKSSRHHRRLSSAQSEQKLDVFEVTNDWLKNLTTVRVQSSSNPSSNPSSSPSSSSLKVRDSFFVPQARQSRQNSPSLLTKKNSHSSIRSPPFSGHHHGGDKSITTLSSSLERILRRETNMSFVEKDRRSTSSTSSSSSSSSLSPLVTRIASSPPRMSLSNLSSLSLSQTSISPVSTATPATTTTHTNRTTNHAMNNHTREREEVERKQVLELNNNSNSNNNNNNNSNNNNSNSRYRSSSSGSVMTPTKNNTTLDFIHNVYNENSVSGSGGGGSSTTMDKIKYKSKSQQLLETKSKNHSSHGSLYHGNKSSHGHGNNNSNSNRNSNSNNHMNNSNNGNDKSGLTIKKSISSTSSKSVIGQLNFMSHELRSASPPSSFFMCGSNGHNGNSNSHGNSNNGENVYKFPFDTNSPIPNDTLSNFSNGYEKWIARQSRTLPVAPIDFSFRIESELNKSFGSGNYGEDDEMFASGLRYQYTDESESSSDDDDCDGDCDGYEDDDEDDDGSGGRIRRVKHNGFVVVVHDKRSTNQSHNHSNGHRSSCHRRWKSDQAMYHGNGMEYGSADGSTGFEHSMAHDRQKKHSNQSMGHVDTMEVDEFECTRMAGDSANHDEAATDSMIDVETCEVADDASDDELNERNEAYDTSILFSDDYEGIFQCSSLVEKLFYACNLAADRGYQTLVQLLQLIENRNINLLCDPSKNNMTLLHAAAKSNNPGIIELLIQRYGANIECTDNLLATPLHYACGSNSKAAVLTLLGLGANVNARDRYENFPLLIAMKNNYVQVMKTLILFNADIYLKTKNGDTCLHMAAREGYSKRVKFMIQELKMSPSRLNAQNENVLFVGLAHRSITQIICDRAEDYKTLCRMVTVSNVKGKTVFHKVAENGNIESLLIILQALRTKFAAQYANKENSCHILREFVYQRLNEYDISKGYTPLHFAVVRKRLKLVKFLSLCAQVDIDRRDVRSGMTALHMAIEAKDQEMCDMLVKMGKADTTLKYKKETVSRMAARNGIHIEAETTKRFSLQSLRKSVGSTFTQLFE